MVKAQNTGNASCRFRLRRSDLPPRNARFLVAKESVFSAQDAALPCAGRTFSQCVLPPPAEGGPVSREIFRCEEERFVSALRAGRKGRAGGMHFRRKSDRSVHVPPSVQRVPGDAPLRRTALAWLCLCVAQVPERSCLRAARAKAAALGKRERISYDILFFKVCHFFLHYYQDSICRIP